MLKAIYIFVLVLAFVSTSHVLRAQKKDYPNAYKNAKELFKEGRYTLAMESFKQLFDDNSDNPYDEHAHFYYAISAYRAKQSAVAKNMFTQLLQKYPKWKNREDVYYWLAKLNFENGQLSQGIQELKKITSQKVKDDAQKMKLFYLKNIQEPLELQKILEQNPDDKDVAVELANRIVAQPLVVQNQQVLEQIIEKYKLDKDKYGVSEVALSEKKNSYNVGVLLPFMSAELKQRSSIKGNFVFNTWAGIVLGGKVLEEQGIKLNIYAYDTRRDSVEAMNVLNMPELRSMDLLIGPLYETPIRVTSAFSRRNQINMVNPISMNSEVIGNNPYSFLLKSSFETQAKRVSEYASKTFFNKNAVIFYGPSKKDSVLAFQYKKSVEEKGFKLTHFKRFERNEARRALDLLTHKTGDSLSLPTRKAGHIFLASDDEILVTNIISAIDIRRDQVPLIGYEDWLDFKMVNYDQMERLGVLLISPNFIDYSDPAVEGFKEAYLQHTNSLPDRFAYSGYASILFFGKMLHEHGTHFQQGLEKAGSYKGSIFAGYNFTNSNDNQLVPIVKFVNSELVIQNQ